MKPFESINQFKALPYGTPIIQISGVGHKKKQTLLVREHTEITTTFDKPGFQHLPIAQGYTYHQSLSHNPESGAIEIVDDNHGVIIEFFLA